MEGGDEIRGVEGQGGRRLLRLGFGLARLPGEDPGGLGEVGVGEAQMFRFGVSFHPLYRAQTGQGQLFQQTALTVEPV